MEKRLDMAMSMSMGPEFLFLDEPFTFLDEKRQNQLAKELYRVNKKFHIAMMMVNHTLKPLEDLPFSKG